MRCFKPITMQEPHWHGHVEANLISGAAMTYFFDDREIVVPENRLVIFWAGIPHQLTRVHPTGNGPMQLNNIYVPADAFLFLPHIGQLQASLLSGGMAMLPAPLCTKETIAGWYADYRSNDFERLEVVKMELNAMLRRAQTQEITYLAEPFTRLEKGRILGSAHVHHVVAMVRFILENLSEPMSNSDVAAVTGLHENYAATLFSKIMRVPIKRFTIRMRLLRARAQLIENSTAISQIVQNCGFSSVSQFYDHFRQAYGTSPDRLRQHYKNNRI